MLTYEHIILSIYYYVTLLIFSKINHTCYNLSLKLFWSCSDFCGNFSVNVIIKLLLYKKECIREKLFKASLPRNSRSVRGHLLLRKLYENFCVHCVTIASVLIIIIKQAGNCNHETIIFCCCILPRVFPRNLKPCRTHVSRLTV